ALAVFSSRKGAEVVSDFAVSVELEFEAFTRVGFEVRVTELLVSSADFADTRTVAAKPRKRFNVSKGRLGQNLRFGWKAKLRIILVESCKALPYCQPDTL